MGSRGCAYCVSVDIADSVVLLCRNRPLFGAHREDEHVTESIKSFDVVDSKSWTSNSRYIEAHIVSPDTNPASIKDGDFIEFVK